MEILVAILVGGGLVAGFLGLRCSRGNVMGYHDIETPRVNQTRRDGDGEATTVAASVAADRHPLLSVS